MIIRMSKMLSFLLITAILSISLVPESSISILCDIKGTATVLAEPLEYAVSNPHVIINQVYGSAKDAKDGIDGYVSHTFIELYNNTDKLINMKGWSVHYRSSADGGLDGWKKLELTGSIDSHSSYQIRCAEVKGTDSIKYTISSFDQEWDQRIHNKGFSVILLSNTNDIGDSQVFDCNTKKPLIDGYVDMLSAGGNGED